MPEITEKFSSTEIARELKSSLEYYGEPFEHHASPFQQEAGFDKPPSFYDETKQELLDKESETAVSFEEVPLAPELLTHPYNFNFYQAVLIFLWLADKANWVRRIRFKSLHGLGFPASDLIDVTIPPSRDMPIEMTVSFLGLVSHGSIVPTPYIEYMIEDQYKSDGALLDFLDIFNDRILSLLVKSKLRRKLSLSLQVQTIPPVTRFLSALTGPAVPVGVDKHDRLASISTLEVEKSQKGVQNKVRWPRCLLLSSFLTRHVASANSLAKLLFAYTGIPVRVEEFEGSCRALSTRQLTVMGKRGYNRSLGRTFTLGHKVWLGDSGINIIFEVYKRKNGIRWFADRVKILNLKQLVMLHLGFPCITFNFLFILGGKDIPPLKLTSSAKSTTEIQQRLGIASVLFSQKAPEQVQGKLSYLQIKRIKV